jgi:hypothetical protein
MPVGLRWKPDRRSSWAKVVQSSSRARSRAMLSVRLSFAFVSVAASITLVRPIADQTEVRSGLVHQCAAIPVGSANVKRTTSAINRVRANIGLF